MQIKSASLIQFIVKAKRLLRSHSQIAYKANSTDIFA